MIKMKKSNIILASFLVFIVGATMVLNLDFKMNEVAYKDKMEIRIFKLNKYRKDYRNSYNKVLDSITKVNWDAFIYKSTLLLSSGYSRSVDEFEASRFVYNNFKVYHDTTALYHSRAWAKNAAIRNESNLLYNDNYARILFELGFINEAVKYAEIAAKEAIKQGLNTEGVYSKRLAHFKESQIIKIVRTERSVKTDRIVE